jgi:MFS family permease
MQWQYGDILRDLAGAFISGYVSDGIGRRGTILTATLFFCFGAALQCGSQDNSFLMGGRFVTGMGIGMYCMVKDFWSTLAVHPAKDFRLCQCTRLRLLTRQFEAI